MQSQIKQWINNIWAQELNLTKRQDDHLVSSNPSDILNVLKSQVSIASDRLSKNNLILVTKVGSSTEAFSNLHQEWLKLLLTEHKSHCDELMSSADLEQICCNINDISELQVTASRGCQFDDSSKG